MARSTRAEMYLSGTRQWFSIRCVDSVVAIGSLPPTAWPPLAAKMLATRLVDPPASASAWQKSPNPPPSSC